MALQIRGAAWWANAIATTAPGDTPPDQYQYNTALNQPVLSRPGIYICMRLRGSTDDRD